MDSAAAVPIIPCQKSLRYVEIICRPKVSKNCVAKKSLMIFVLLGLRALQIDLLVEKTSKYSPTQVDCICSGVVLFRSTFKAWLTVFVVFSSSLSFLQPTGERMVEKAADLDAAWLKPEAINPTSPKKWSVADQLPMPTWAIGITIPMSTTKSSSAPSYASANACASSRNCPSRWRRRPASRMEAPTKAHHLRHLLRNVKTNNNKW